MHFLFNVFYTLLKMGIWMSTKQMSQFVSSKSSFPRCRFKICRNSGNYVNSSNFFTYIVVCKLAHKDSVQPIRSLWWTPRVRTSRDSCPVPIVCGGNESADVFVVEARVCTSIPVVKILSYIFFFCACPILNSPSTFTRVLLHGLRDTILVVCFCK